MSGSISRRGFLAGAAAMSAAGGALAAPAQRPASPPTAPQGLAAYQYESQIWVRLNGRPLTCYRAGAHQKYPYFFPLAGPLSGLPMTDESGDPYPHHRSLFLGCDRVNGGNYWQDSLAQGQIISRGPRIEAHDPRQVVIADTCDWKKPNEPAIILDKRKWTIEAPSPDVRLISAEIELAAQVEVRISKTNHSFFSIRAARDLTPAGGGMMRNSLGMSGEKDTAAQKATWCGFGGQRLGRTESIILMDHPGNPWSPCPWFTRDYGFASPTPFYWIDNDWVLPAGKSIRLRYMVALLGTGFDTDQIDAIYKRFAV